MHHQEALHVTAARAEALEIESRPVFSAFYGRKLDAAGKVHAVECLHARVAQRAYVACVHAGMLCMQACVLVVLFLHLCSAKTRTRTRIRTRTQSGKFAFSKRVCYLCTHERA